MAKPTTKKYSQFLIQIGDGASPETFSAPCGLTSKGFNQTKSMQETAVPDCNDPDAPSYSEKGVDTISSEISGSGVLAMEAFDTWNEFFNSTESRNCRIEIVGKGYWQGAFHLTTFNITAQRGQKINVDITLQNDGEYPWVDAS